MPSFPSRLRLCRLDMCSGLHNRAQGSAEALCSWVSLHPKRLWPARPHVLFCIFSRATSQPPNLRQIVLFNHTDLLKINTGFKSCPWCQCECYLLSTHKESWCLWFCSRTEARLSVPPNTSATSSSGGGYLCINLWLHLLLLFYAIYGQVVMSFLQTTELSLMRGSQCLFLFCLVLYFDYFLFYFC